MSFSFAASAVVKKMLRQAQHDSRSGTLYIKSQYLWRYHCHALYCMGGFFVFNIFVTLIVGE